MTQCTLISLADGRHESVQSIARYFEFEHLPAYLQPVSRRIHDVAFHIVADIPDSPELTAGLRKLLEAKDCFVRAAL